MLRMVFEVLLNLFFWVGIPVLVWWFIFAASGLCGWVLLTAVLTTIILTALAFLLFVKGKHGTD